MSLLDTANQKALDMLSRAEHDILERTSEAANANEFLSQVQKAANDKAVADKSAQEAEIKQLEVQIESAQSKLDNDKAIADLVRTLTDLPVISGPTESIRKTCDALVAQDQADVDDLMAQLSAVRASIAPADSGDESALKYAEDRFGRAKLRLAMAKKREQLAQSALETLGKLSESD